MSLAACIGAYFPRLRTSCFTALWLSYLSLVSVGGPFFQYPWDTLLLETGFLAILFSPSPDSRYSVRPQTILFLLHLLLFRLIFTAGLAKICAVDSSWRSLTALHYFFQSQPLPTPLAWYLHRLPETLLSALAGSVLAIELVVPWLLFFTSSYRRFAAGTLLLMQLCIALSGNFGIYPLLTGALALLALDDGVLENFFGKQCSTLTPEWRSPVAFCFAVLGTLLIPVATIPNFTWPPPVTALYGWAQHLRIVNGYGWLPPVAPQRMVVILEGSQDGISWSELTTRWLPQHLDEAPRIAGFYQPRIDWQLNTLPLVQPHSQPWFTQLVGGLLANAGAAAVFTNFEPSHAPRQVRALIYRYEFLQRADRKISKRWWKRKLLGIYLHPVRTPEQNRATPASVRPAL